MGSMQMIDMTVVGIVVLMMLFFLILACVKFDVYDKVFEKIIDTKSPLHVIDILGKHRGISQQKLLKIQ